MGGGFRRTASASQVLFTATVVASLALAASPRLGAPAPLLRCFALHRKPIVVNLDPANDDLPYTCSVDIAELITLDDVMDAYGLGPNGGTPPVG